MAVFDLSRSLLKVTWGLLSLHGVKMMQSLIAEHGKKIIAGGALNGQMYENIDLEKLRKVAKRYKADPSFQKFARACVALHEFSPEDEPRPCVPVLMPVGRVAPEGSNSLTSGFGRKLLEILGLAQKYR